MPRGLSLLALAAGAATALAPAAAPLGHLDGSGKLPFAVDFRDLYATVLERWWGVPSAPVLIGRFTPVAFLKA